MKYYLVEENGEIKKVGAQGFTPKNVIARVPEKLKRENKEALDIVDVVDAESGETRKEVRLNAEKKQQLLAQEEAAEQEASRKETAQVTARELVRSFEPKGTTIAQLRAEVKTLSDALKELI